MELFVYDKSRRLAGIVEAYSYLKWTRRYSACGNFELRAVANKNNVALLRLGNIVWKNDDTEAAIIEYAELTEEEQESVTVRGRFGTGLLARRIVWGTENLRGDISEAVGQLINRHVISPDDPRRSIAGFKFDSEYLDIPVNSQVSYKNVLTAIENLCAAADLGFRTRWDGASGLFTFTLYRGGESRTVFSRDYENLRSQSYVRSELDYCNAALVAGEGEGEERRIISIDEDAHTGEDRRELFVDAKDLRIDAFGGVSAPDGVSAPVDDYDATLAQRGNEKLAERGAVLAFDAAINLHSNYKYKHDYDLGDVARVSSSKWGVTLTARITEIEETYQRDGMSAPDGRALQVIFGRGLLSLAERLREE